MSIKAQYRGNSSPGQLVDSSGNGNTLTVIGTAVPNPSTPTPPEGDRWLAGPAVDVSYFEAPQAVVAATSGSVEGDFRSSLGTEVNRFVDDVLLSFNGTNDDVQNKFALILDSTPPLGQIRIYFFQILPVLNSAGYNFVDSGQDHHFKLEWSPTGTRLYLDSLLVASTLIAPTFDANDPTIVGWGYTGSSQTMDYGYLDDVIFSDDAVVAQQNSAKVGVDLDVRI